MAFYVPGPLSGPAPARRRNPLWRIRRVLFLLAVLAGVGLAVAWSFASQVELAGDDFDSLTETSYICTAEVQFECGPENAANQWALQGEDRVVVTYDDIPELLIQAVIATEDKSFFEHQGVDPVGLGRAVFQTGKRKLFGSGSLQGGSTITQQYIKLLSGDSKDTLGRKGREVVRAIKLEQELGDELGSKEAAKEQILERYLNRQYLGRRSYGIAAAARNFYDKDLDELTLAEAAYLAGKIRKPNQDPAEDMAESERLRNVTLILMEAEGYITAEEREAASADPWASLVAEDTSVEGLGDVKGAEYGTEYFVQTVRKDLGTIFPEGEYFSQSLRIYTTLNHDLQMLAYDTVVNRLDPANPDMPGGALVSVDDNGRVVAMMAGSKWPDEQTNLVTAQGGSGFQPGSTMKPVVLAEFIEQGFSPESFYENKTVEFPDYPGWKILGRRNPPHHRSVYEATRWSTNSIYAQMIIDVGIDDVVEMSERLGITSDVPEEPSIVLGSNAVGPWEMATVYSTFKNEGIRQRPSVIDRIEDSEGNVLCWYPRNAGDCDGTASVADSARVGDQVIDASVARQVNSALVDVVANGTGKDNARLFAEDGSQLPAAGKTGTTNDARDAWFVGFSCELTTAVWMGYPGVTGQVGIRYMQDSGLRDANEERVAEGLEPWPMITELFPEVAKNEEMHGGDVPADMWSDYMVSAEALLGAEPCEIATERPGSGQKIKGQELLTTLIPCEEPSAALVAEAEAERNATSVPQPPDEQGGGDASGAANGNGNNGNGNGNGNNGNGNGNGNNGNGNGNGGNGNSEDAAGTIVNVGLRREAQTFLFGRPVPAQDGNNGNGNGNNGNGNGNGNGNQPSPSPTTIPCLPVDLDGKVIEGPVTTLDPSGPVTIDPNTSTTTFDPNSSTTTLDPTAPVTVDPNVATTVPEEVTTPTEAVDPAGSSTTALIEEPEPPLPEPPVENLDEGLIEPNDEE